MQTDVQNLGILFLAEHYSAVSLLILNVISVNIRIFATESHVTLPKASFAEIKTKIFGVVALSVTKSAKWI